MLLDQMLEKIHPKLKEQIFEHYRIWYEIRLRREKLKRQSKRAENKKE